MTKKTVLSDPPRHKRSQLHQHAAKLLELHGQGYSFTQIQAYLKEIGITVTRQMVSWFIHSVRDKEIPSPATAPPIEIKAAEKKSEPQPVSAPAVSESPKTSSTPERQSSPATNAGTVQTTGSIRGIQDDAESLFVDKPGFKLPLTKK